MDESKIARINELYHKSKEVGLSDAELKEQLILRKEYIDSASAVILGDSLTTFLSKRQMEVLRI